MIRNVRESRSRGNRRAGTALSALLVLALSAAFLSPILGVSDASAQTNGDTVAEEPPDVSARSRRSSRSVRQYTAGHKFRRGVSNLALGVLAIPGQMTVKSREDGYAIGLPLGFAQGMGWFVASEIIGIWEFLTCPFEFPPRFRPIIEPEHPWNYFEKRSTGAGVP